MFFFVQIADMRFSSDNSRFPHLRNMISKVKWIVFYNFVRDFNFEICIRLYMQDELMTELMSASSENVEVS